MRIGYNTVGDVLLGNTPLERVCLQGYGFKKTIPPGTGRIGYSMKPFEKFVQIKDDARHKEMMKSSIMELYHMRNEEIKKQSNMWDIMFGIVKKLEDLLYRLVIKQQDQSQLNCEYEDKISRLTTLLSKQQEQIEKIEKELFNIQNPPLKPIYKNPFD